MKTDIFTSKNQFFMHLVATILAFGVSAIALSAVFGYFIFSNDENALETMEFSVKLTFCIALFFAFPFFFCIYKIYEIAKAKILHEEQKIIGFEHKLKEREQLIKDEIVMDADSALAKKFVLERDLQKMKNANIFVLEIDDYSKIINFYSVDLVHRVISTLSAEFKEFASKKGFKPYRLSDTKFAMINDEKYGSKKDLTAIAKELSAKFKGYEITNGEEYINVCCTIGLCMGAQNALNKALVALELAQDRELDYVLYDEKEEGLQTKINEWKYRYGLIIEAMENHTIVPYFQPIFDLSGKICKYETLARIISKQGEVVLPGVFLDYSRHIKRYVDLSKQLIIQSCEMVAKTPDMKISINMSISDMISNPLRKFIVREIDSKNIGERVIIEILENESVSAKDAPKVKEYIASLRQRGIKIAVDDFGSGFSNFNLLLEIVPDYIKIDGGIVKHVCDDTKARDMVLAIVAFAKNLGAKVVAEYVASKEIYDECVRLGVDEFQGFYLGEPSSKPMILNK